MTDTNTIHDFKVGDRVKRIGSSNGRKNVGDEFVIVSVHSNTPPERYSRAVDENGTRHYFVNLEPVPMFSVGDIVRRKTGGLPWTIMEVATPIRVPAARDRAGTWHHLENLVLVTAVASLTPAPRRPVVGDQMRRIRGSGGYAYRAVGHVFTVDSVNADGSVRDQDGNHHDADRIELLPAAPEGPRPFRAGDTVLGSLGVERVIRRLESNNGHEGARFTNGAWDHLTALTLLIPVVAPRPFRVGDVVTGSVGTERTIRSLDTTFAVFTNGGGDPIASLTLVTPAPEVAPRPFEAGDLVRRLFGKGSNAGIEEGGTFTVSRVTSGMVVDHNGAGHYQSSVELVSTAAEAEAARKPGETPTGLVDVPDGKSPHIAINDPRIAWIWKDLGDYADGKDWCPEYEKLAAVLSIPGRVKKFSGHIMIAGQRVEFKDIEAADQTEARRAFRTKLAADLTAAAA